MTIFEASVAYKPFKYDFERYWSAQHGVHWTAAVVDFHKDRSDYITMDSELQETIKYILLLFTQLDVSVAESYSQVLLPNLKNNEAQRALLSFADMETVHQDAYAKLVDVLNLGDDFYKAYADDKIMVDRLSSITDVSHAAEDEDYGMAYEDIKWDVVGTLAINFAGSEGFMLQSAFIFLKAFCEESKPTLMQNMANVINWSLRDENIHTTCQLSILSVILEESENIGELGAYFNIISQVIRKHLPEIRRAEIEFIESVYRKFDGNGAVSAIIKEKDIVDYMNYMMDINIDHLYNLLESCLELRTDIVTDDALKTKLELRLISLKGEIKKPSKDFESYEKIRRLLNLSAASNFFELTPTDYGAGFSDHEEDEFSYTSL